MTPKIQTAIRLPPRLLDWLKRQAADKECSVSEYVRNLLMRVYEAEHDLPDASKPEKKTNHL